MTRRHIILTILAAMALSVSIVIVSMAYSVRNQRAIAHRQSIEATEAAPPEIGYVLKEYEGELAVFRGSSSTPFRRLGVPLAVMTDYDREQLKAGIYVLTEGELNSLIEDYSS